MKIEFQYALGAVFALSLTSLPVIAADCSNGEDCYVRDVNPELILTDTDVGETNWHVEADWACNECFDVFSWESSTYPFTIENGAGTNLLFLDALNRVGVNTSTPSNALHIVGDRIRMQSNSSSKELLMRADGAAADVQAENADLFLQAGLLYDIVMHPFSNNGMTGIGTTTPAARLHLLRSSNNELRVENSGATTTDQAMFRLVGRGSSKVRFLITAGGSQTWTFDNSPITDSFSISKLGTGVNEFKVNSLGDGTFQRNSYALNHINTSSRASKEDFSAIDVQRVLEQVAMLPISQWRYKSEQQGAAHVGPVAEDFQKIFGLGDGKHISTVDASGVSLAAIKGLHQALQEKDAEIAALSESLEKQGERMLQMEMALSELLNEESGEIRVSIRN